MLALHLSAQALRIADELCASRIARSDARQIGVSVDADGYGAGRGDCVQPGLVVGRPSSRIRKQHHVTARRPLGNREAHPAVAAAVESGRGAGAAKNRHATKPSSADILDMGLPGC